jgi:hypothetical protein
MIFVMHVAALGKDMYVECKMKHNFKAPQLVENPDSWTQLAINDA